MIEIQTLLQSFDPDNNVDAVLAGQINKGWQVLGVSIVHAPNNRLQRVVTLQREVKSSTADGYADANMVYDTTVKPLRKQK